MADSREFMTNAAAQPDAGTYPPDLPTHARGYGLLLGRKDNCEVDRQAVLRLLEAFPEAVDVSRENRRLLYRAVRYLAREEGIGQFLDIGSGLPTQDNVHEVAQRFQPGAGGLRGHRPGRRCRAETRLPHPFPVHTPMTKTDHWRSHA